MAVALTGLKKQIQIGNEATPGSAVAATEVLLAAIDAPTTSRINHNPEDDRNMLAVNKSNRFKVADAVELVLEGALNSRQAVFLFGNAIRGNITPTQPDATNEPLAYLWTYQGGLTTGNTPDVTDGIDTYTIEYGDNVDDYEVEYCFTKTLVLTGEANEPVKFECTITGGQVTAGITPTPALAVPTSIQYFPSNKVSFYIDTSYAAIGSAVKTDLLKSWTWTLETMFTARFTASGSYILAGVSEDAKKVDLEMEYLRSTAQSETEKAIWLADGVTYLRIKLEADDEIDSAQTNPPYIYLDGAFEYTEWETPDDNDGARTTTVKAESTYDATGTRDYEVAVFTDLATWPS